MVVALSDTLIGAAFAVAAATAFAVQFLCIRIGTDDGSVLDAVMITVLSNTVLIVPLVVVAYWGSLSALYTPTSLAAFAAAGVVGIFLARVLMFKSVETIGASRTAPIVSSNVLFATVFAYLFLGERVTLGHLAGIVLVVGGVAALSLETASNEGDARPLRQQGAELAVPIAAAALIGIEPIFITGGLTQGTPVLPGLAVMVVAGTIGFVGYWLATRSELEVTPGSAALKWYLAAGVATTVAFVAYFAALERSTVVVVMPILQTNPLIVMVLSGLFLPRRLERVTWRLVAAALVIVSGAILVSVFG